MTSYFNFTSNHKLIVARIGASGNKLSNETIRKLHNPFNKFMKKETEEADSPEKNIFKEKETTDNNEDHVISDDDVDESDKIPKQNVDYSSLRGNSWLTDDVINQYGKLISEQFTDTFVFSTHFLTSLKNRGYENSKGWTKGVDVL